MLSRRRPSSPGQPVRRPRRSDIRAGSHPRRPLVWQSIPFVVVAGMQTKHSVDRARKYRSSRPLAPCRIVLDKERRRAAAKKRRSRWIDKILDHDRARCLDDRGEGGCRNPLEAGAIPESRGGGSTRAPRLGRVAPRLRYDGKSWAYFFTHSVAASALESWRPSFSNTSFW